MGPALRGRAGVRLPRAYAQTIGRAIVATHGNRTAGGEHFLAHVYCSPQLDMIPFLHLGPLTIPTFGLMVALALLVSAYVLQADFDRRRAQLASIPDFRGQKDEG